MATTKDICVVCAWRADCQKKFSVSSRGIRCADFVRDLTFPEDKEGKEPKEEKKKT